jgi:hypothetical protein
MRHVEVIREPDGLWHWRYVEPRGQGEQPFTLWSTHSYESQVAAAHAASSAYPDALLLQPRSRPQRRLYRRVNRWLIALALLAVWLLVPRPQGLWRLLRNHRPSVTSRRR